MSLFIQLLILHLFSSPSPFCVFPCPLLLLSPSFLYCTHIRTAAGVTAVHTGTGLLSQPIPWVGKHLLQTHTSPSKHFEDYIPLGTLVPWSHWKQVPKRPREVGRKRGFIPECGSHLVFIQCGIVKQIH